MVPCGRRWSDFSSSVETKSPDPGGRRSPDTKEQVEFQGADDYDVPDSAPVRRLGADSYYVIDTFIPGLLQSRGSLQEDRPGPRLPTSRNNSTTTMIATVTTPGSSRDSTRVSNKGKVSTSLTPVVLHSVLQRARQNGLCPKFRDERLGGRHEFLRCPISIDQTGGSRFRHGVPPDVPPYSSLPPSFSTPSVPPSRRLSSAPRAGRTSTSDVREVDGTGAVTRSPDRGGTGSVR